MLFSIFILFAERTFLICAFFRKIGFSFKAVKWFFSIVSLIIIVRLANYVYDWGDAATPWPGVLFNMAVAFGVVRLSFQIYKRKLTNRPR